MATEISGAGDWNERHRWGENNKVYTRKFRNKNLVDNNTSNSSIIAKNINDDRSNSDAQNNESNDKIYGIIHHQSVQSLAAKELNSLQEKENVSQLNLGSGHLSGHNQPLQFAAENGYERPDGNGTAKPIITKVDDRVRISLAAAGSKHEIRELKRKLLDELDQVRSLVMKLEAKKIELIGHSTINGGYDGGHGHLHHSAKEGSALPRMNSEIELNGYPAVNGGFGHLHNSAKEVRALVRMNSEVELDGYPAVNGGDGHLDNSAKEGRALVRMNSEVGSVGNHDQRLEGRALVRMNSEIGSVGHHDSRPFQRLSVQVLENNHDVNEFVEKEKRTPKANQFYRSSEFLLGKERLPPAESNKKLKSNSVKKHGGEMGCGYVMEKYFTQALRSCNSLLTRLMKHKFAWVFNKPVDAKTLGLHDYHIIITNPMDLGTVKSRLAKNWYKSPREFAEDVRLTFRNAMTYNPKGQDVHIMAEVLSKYFEDKWAGIESEYSYDWRYELVHNMGLPTPTSRKVRPPPPTRPPALDMRILERAESITMPTDSKLKPNTPVGRTPVPKKPKAKDPHKRDMTYEEKQRLSTNLQNLPSDKLDAIVQIIKKSNSSLSQRDDEIEVDIDSVDAETLWELDRFVTNYKKNMSKKRRKAELALQARAETRPATSTTNHAPAISQAPKKTKKDENSGSTFPFLGERLGVDSDSSSSSSSSSDSDSSSSDSDSDSSSGYGSDAGHSPQT